MRNKWPETTITEAESGSDHHQLLYRIDKHMQENGGPKPYNGNEPTPGTPIHRPTRNSIAPSTGGKGGRKLSFDSKPGSYDSGCALYLLSTLQSQSSEFSLLQSRIMNSSSTESPSGSVVHFDANTSNLHCNGLLQMGSDGLIENEDSLPLPFFWE